MIAKLFRKFWLAAAVMGVATLQLVTPLPQAAMAGPAPQNPLAALYSPMRFIPVRFSVRAPAVSPGILAVGKIGSHEDKDFVEFLQRHPSLADRVSMVYFLSPGGRVVGGENLGRTIRRLGMRTEVAVPSSVAQQDNIIGALKTLINLHYIRGHLSADAAFEGELPSVCASACTMAFIGGTARHILRGSAFLVHRAKFGRKYNKTPHQGSVLGQLVIGEYSVYVQSMGVDARLINTMVRGGQGPLQNARVGNKKHHNAIIRLSRAEMTEYNVITKPVIVESESYPSSGPPLLVIRYMDGLFDFSNIGFSCSTTQMLLAGVHLKKPFTAADIHGVSFKVAGEPGSSLWHLTIPVPTKFVFVAPMANGHTTLEIGVPPGGPLFYAITHAKGIKVIVETIAGKISEDIGYWDATNKSSPVISHEISMKIYQLAAGC